MMKGSKYLLLLASFMVGFGLVGVADAAVVNSIAVTSPDSGAIKGIDSTFVVTARVIDLSAEDSLEVVMYLATTSDSVVVGDTNNAAVEWGGLQQQTVITIARDLNMRRVGATTLKDGEQVTQGIRSTNTGYTSLVAVQQKRKRANTSALGDADSVNVAISGDTTTFVWHGKIDASSGTMSGVRAAVFVIDATSGSFVDTSQISLSATSKQFKVDADRPAGPELQSTGKAGGVGHISLELFGGRDAVVVNTERPVLGIGDSLKVRSKLGTDIANDVVLGDSLTVVLDVHAQLYLQ
jgi:hypothetical protein